MPLSDKGGLVTCFLNELGYVLLMGMKDVSKGIDLIVVAVLCVSMEARLGTQMELVQKALSKTTPSSANLLMF